MPRRTHGLRTKQKRRRAERLRTVPLERYRGHRWYEQAGDTPYRAKTGSGFLTRPGFLPLSDADSEDFSTRGVPHAATPQAGGHD